MPKKYVGKAIYNDIVGEDGKKGFRTFDPYNAKFIKYESDSQSNNASYFHKGLGTGRPYEETAIARDINKVKKERD